jgi:superfamily I DNA/RNA helicase
MLYLLSMGYSVYMRDETLVNSIISKITTFKKLLKEDLSKLPEVINTLFEEQEKKEQEKLDKLINEGKVDSSNDLSLSNNVIDLLDCIMVIYGNYKRKYINDNKKLNSFKDFIKFVEALLQTKDTKNSIQCTSIHQAKGKEYNRVFILNEAKVYYELGRSADQVQQEVNLSYIALTRSKDTIYLVEKPEDEDDEYEEDFATIMFTDYDENTANEIW